MKSAALFLSLVLLCCTASAQKDTLPRRPQEEILFVFSSRGATFQNTKDSITLSGTLSYFRDGVRQPAVLLIGGSGATDRDGTILGHKPLKMIADSLSKNDYTVLRYDERGVGKSTGKAQGADIDDLVRDAKAALAYLKKCPETDTNNIGIIGHSEGAAIALKIAAEDPSVKFLISLAGPGVDGVEFILTQTEAIYRNMGWNDSMTRVKVAEQRAMATAIAEEYDTAKLKARIAANAKAQYAANPMLKTAYTEEKFTSLLTSVYMIPEYLSIIRFDPKKYFPAVKCPVLALNGSKDIQVISSINLTGWRNGVRQATIKELPGLNHLFQECKTCSVQEYASIKQTISPAVLEEINSWLRQTTRPRK